MEYQKRLRLINYVKNNFTVKKNELVVIHYPNLDNLELITAEKLNIKSSGSLANYAVDREKLNLGCCFILDTYEEGSCLDFYDHYLTYREYIAINSYVINSLRESPTGHKIEIMSELDQMIRELNGEEPIYRPSNC
jgi:hypothetical protein